VRALGAAASLLNDSPITTGKVAEAEAQLRQLLAENSADEPALYARYLLARIAHLHRPAEIAEIEAAYRAVIAAAPAHPLAQLAAGKLALVLLYQRPDLGVPQRLAAAAALAPVAGAAQLPETACAYYRVLAEAALYYDVLDGRVLAWLQRADAIGTNEIMTATSLRIQLAEVARALGRREEALAYYRQFLATAVPTDNRYRTVADRMAELAKEAK
jgi:tetratricopeptide (TPR) repeat protein